MSSKMKTFVEITDEFTGHTVGYVDDYEWETWEGQDSPDTGVIFQWGEGNYACDCNRSLFYHRNSCAQRGLEFDEDSDETPCGDKRYSVKVFEHGTGRLILEDRRKTQAKA